MSIVISFVNHKGGVAKTTSAVNVAWGLARAGYSVLLVDMDPQSNTTQSVGLNPYSSDNNIYGAMIGKYDLPVVPIAEAVEPNGGRLSVVPSCLDLAAAELQLVVALDRERTFDHLLDPVRNNFDFVLIDCPPSLGLLTTNALAASGSLLIPMQPQYFAIQGLKQLLDAVSKIQKGLNRGLRIRGVFLTDYNGRTKMHTDAAAAIEQAFPDEIFATKIRHNVALSECAAMGKSIFDYDPKSNGAADYASLTGEIMERYGVAARRII